MVGGRDNSLTLRSPSARGGLNARCPNSEAAKREHQEESFARRSYPPPHARHVAQEALRGAVEKRRRSGAVGSAFTGASGVYDRSGKEGRAVRVRAAVGRRGNNARRW